MNEQDEVCGGITSAPGSGARRRAALGAGVLLVAGMVMLLGRNASERAPTGATKDAAATPAARPRAAASQASSGGPPNLDPADRADGHTSFPAPSVQLGAVIEQVHYAYRPQGGAWRGGHSTYEVVLQPGGLLEVKPFHYANGRPTDAPSAAALADPAELALRERASTGEVLEGDSVTFAPSRLARGGEVIAAGAGEAQTNDRGQLEIFRGAVVEQLANGPAGIEQSWRFAHRPVGKGDLEVRLPVRAAEFTGETEHGLHFTGGRLGIRYGHATWVDALGVETPVAARWDGSAIVLRVPEAAVDGSVYPAVLDPVIGPELGMDDPILGPAARDQLSPAAAWDGQNHLVVWQDSRKGAYDIYGARVSAAGEVLDPMGIPISTAAGNQQNPVVAWDGQNYLVVWQDQRSGFGDDIWGARVTPGGMVLDEIAISTAADYQGYAALAWDGSNYLVVWQDSRNGPNERDIYGALVTPGGQVFDAIAISTAVNSQSSPELAWNGTDYLVVWTDYRSGTNYDVYGARVSSAGVVLDTAGIPIAATSTYQGVPAVACGGSDCLVAWSEPRGPLAGGTGNDIYGARVSGAGVVLDATGFEIAKTANTQWMAAVAWNGSNYLVVWQDARSGTYDVYGARVTTSGAVLDPAGIAISTAANAQTSPALSWDGGNLLVVWMDNRGGANDIYGARVSPAGAVLDTNGIAVSTAENDQSFPALAWDGTNYLVVWSDLRSGANLDIYGARMSDTGAVLDASGIAISTAGGDQSYPAVAWDGTNYLVVWQDRRDPAGDHIYGARVSADGAVLDAITISTAASIQADPKLAWNGSEYLVVWEQPPSGQYYWDVYGARVSGDGVVLDPDPIAISTAAFSQARPTVAWDGGNFLVVWQDTRREVYRDIYGARVSAGGTVLDPTGIAISTVASQKWLPVLAWDGRNYLVVWMDDQSGNYDLYGARVSAAGEVLDAAGIAISTAERDQGYPALAWDGRYHLVVWHDSRSGTSFDVHGARVTPDGVVLDSDGFLVSGSAYDEQNAAVISPAAGRYLVLYDAYGGPPVTSVRRVHAREVRFVAPPVAEAAAATTPEDTPVTLTLTATDADGDPLTYRIASQPAHGTVEASGASAIYTPAADWNGSDVFTFVANDGLDDSTPATVALTVQPVNDPPIARAQSVTVVKGRSLAVTLAASDVDGDALSYSIASPPSHGTLTGAGADRTYTPAASYEGPDSFTFKANDGTVDSSAETVTITVTPVNESAKGGCSCGTMGEATPVGALLFVMLGLGRRRRPKQRRRA